MVSIQEEQEEEEELVKVAEDSLEKREVKWKSEDPPALRRNNKGKLERYQGRNIH